MTNHTRTGIALGTKRLTDAVRRLLAAVDVGTIRSDGGRRFAVSTSHLVLALTVAAAGASRSVAATSVKLERRCHAAVGRAGATCLRDYTDAVRRCRDAVDSTCEAMLRLPGGTLAAIVADVGAPIQETCTSASAERISLSLGVDRLVRYVADGCQKWAEQFFEVAYVLDTGALAPEGLACQRHVGVRLGRLRGAVIAASGACNAARFVGRTCDRRRRDRKIRHAITAARRGIVKRCGATFDQLGLVARADGATLEARVDILLDRVVVPARHYALRVYPQLDLGPTALFGAVPVGVRTFTLADPARPNPAGSGPRTLTVEVYYPSTVEAVAGVPRDVVQVFGIELFPTPAHRDVARASGSFPLVVYSHGSGGIRFENMALAVHLASHGYVVVAPDHPGDTLLDSGDDIGAALTNRPRDVSLLIDRLVASNPEDFFAGGIDAERIAVTGWSYGGYTALALASGAFSLGTFTDPRVKAIIPLDGSAQVFDPDVPALYSTITIPTLLLGASFSDVIAPRLQEMFDGIPPGAGMVGYGSFLRAAHSSFADNCEVPEVLRGRPAACEPEFLPWRHVRHVESYLTLNFLDATLRGDADALARLDPAVLVDVEELSLQRR